MSAFLNQLAGFEKVAAPFQGVLRITTASPAGLTVAGLRGRTNERGDFLITTTMPINENAPASTGELFFPHFVDGGGYTTQFILFGRNPSQASSGGLIFYGQSGQSATLTLP